MPRPLVRKLGTVECDLVEATPLVFRDRLYRFEYVRQQYQHNPTGDSYLRLVDHETGEATPAFGHGWHLGSAFSAGDRVWAYAVNIWDGDTIRVWWSDDLERWETQVALRLPGWGLFNTSVCQGPEGYVMAFEVGRATVDIGAPFTIFFAQSPDLRSWEMLPPDHVFTKDRYSACPSIRYLSDGWFYMVYLETLSGPVYPTYIVRSRDLITWELSPLNPVLEFSDEDKQIANPRLTEAERQRLAAAENRNNSDMDLCEFGGQTIITYAWGNQQGTEFLAEAVYDGSLESFLQGFFPA
jgi:hypothetical protein